jgi:hypothetical protein
MGVAISMTSARQLTAHQQGLFIVFTDTAMPQHQTYLR